MSKTKHYKQKIRATKEWKELRSRYADEFHNKCALTGKPLSKGWNLHHLDMSEENYADFQSDRFIPLNKKAHEFVHYCYRYYIKDNTFLIRLQNILELMEQYNE